MIIQDIIEINNMLKLNREIVNLPKMAIKIEDLTQKIGKFTKKKNLPYLVIVISMMSRHHAG